VYLTPIVNQPIKDFKVGLSKMQLYHKDHTKKELFFKSRPGHESGNRCSFSRFLEVRRDDAEVTIGAGTV